MSKRTDFEKYFLSKKPYHSAELDDYMKETSRVAGYQTPYILEERQLNVTAVDLASRLLMDRIIWFNHEVNDTTCGIASQQLMYLESIEPGREISLYCSSPGGSVTAGLGLVDVMNFVSSDVAVTNLAMCASMGSIILTSGAKGKRRTLPHARVLLHQPMTGIREGTQASDIQIECDQINLMKKELYTILSETTGQPYEKIWKDADRDFWLSASQSIEYGICDEMIQSIKK